MITNKIVLSTTLWAVISTFGCATSPQVTANPKVDSNTTTSAVAQQANAHNFVEVEFSAGSSLLDKEAKSSLKSVIEQARKIGEIDEVIVLSWSDQEYPSNERHKLNKPQIELAKKRNKAVEAYLKAMRDIDVDSYNMAEQPNTLSKWFNTSDSKLKGALVTAGLPTTADFPDYSGKSSHAVVLVKLK